MFPKVFLLLLFSLFGVKFSSEMIIVSKCNAKCEPTKYNLFDSCGRIVSTAVFQMASTNAFKPILSVELIQYEPYHDQSIFDNSIFFEFDDKLFEFNYIKRSHDEATCSSGLTETKTKSNDCSINKDKNTCKWLLNVGMDGLIENALEIGTSSYDMITRSKSALIALSSWSTTDIAANDVSDLPTYHWSYARYCEYNKKIYDIDGDMITLKKDNSSFELFIYRYINYEYKKPRHVTLINSKNSSISISCDDDRNDIIVSTKTGSKEGSVLDKYISRKHIDGLRCGISLSIEMGAEHSSFSFNDAPLELIYKANDSDITIQEVKFESDFIVVDEPKIETTSTASVDQHDVVDENDKHDTVNPLIGVFLTIITVVKSYFDLW